MSFFIQVLISRFNPSRTVTLFWKEAPKARSVCTPQSCSVVTSQQQPSGVNGSVFDVFSVPNAKYRFQPQVSPNTSISQFWFVVDEHDGSAPVTVDNGGSNFIISPDRLAAFIDMDRTALFNDNLAQIVVAVLVRPFLIPSLTLLTSFNIKVDQAHPKPSRVFIQTSFISQSNFQPLSGTFNLSQDNSFTPMAGYIFYSVRLRNSSVNYFSATVVRTSGTTTTELLDADLVQFLNQPS
jgi:hypothetical protein